MLNENTDEDGHLREAMQRVLLLNCPTLQYNWSAGASQFFKYRNNVEDLAPYATLLNDAMSLSMAGMDTDMDTGMGRTRR